MADIPYWQQRQQMKLKGASKLAAPAEQKKGKDTEEENIEDQPEKKDNLKKGKITTKKVGPKKQAKKIKQRSKKGAKIIKDLKLAYSPFLEKNPICLINAPGCTKKATAVHHAAGRGVTAVLDQKTWQACCEHCNLYVEENHQWAVDNGHKITRLGRPKKFKDAKI